jgi:DNA polymerase III subunit delta'
MAGTAAHPWPVRGHEWAVAYMRKSIRHQRLRHAYLISGPARLGKMQFALALAQALNCEHADADARPCGECRSCRLAASGNHPDLLFSERDEKSGALRIDTIRALNRALALKPFASRYRVAIFDGFGAAQPRAQDALLKTLEEPPDYAILLVLAERPEHVLPTIVSRCQHLPLTPLPPADVETLLLEKGVPADQAALIARVSAGRLGWALAAAADPAHMADRGRAIAALEAALLGGVRSRLVVSQELDAATSGQRDVLVEILYIWQGFWRDVLMLQSGYEEGVMNIDATDALDTAADTCDLTEANRAIQDTREAIRALRDSNVTPRLTLDRLLLGYPGLR